MFFTELLHGHSAARLCSDSFGPLVCFRVSRHLLDERVAHDTTMQHWPAFQEERPEGLETFEKKGISGGFWYL